MKSVISVTLRRFAIKSFCKMKKSACNDFWMNGIYKHLGWFLFQGNLVTKVCVGLGTRSFSWFLIQRNTLYTTHSWWTFRPRKRKFSPPPNSPIRRRHPLGPSPPGIFNKTNPPPPLLAPRTPPSPSPSKKKKTRNVHQALHRKRASRLLPRATTATSGRACY